jgi:hypothetical protein
MIYGILIVLVVILGFTTYNLLIKNEKAEDIILSQNEFISKIKETINYTNQRLTQIDYKGSFEADDEIGFFFKEVKQLQDKLNEFNNKQ